MSTTTKCTVHGTPGEEQLLIEYTNTETGEYTAAFLPWYPEALGDLIEKLHELKVQHAPEYEQLQLFDPDKL